PFPYKFITIASGVFGLNIILFIIISIIGRGFRFYLIAILLYFFGEKIKLIIDKYFNILTIVFFILLVGSVFIIRFL
ncbi:DedA family protein, partial [Pelagibacteraceae bacterium]|nr:DedA family protein [Pelagibacteraceae bacterium]